MAKAKKIAKAPAKVETIDIVDYLTEQMAAETGIPFARDAWENAAPEEYGVVELGSILAEQWADGELIDCVWAINIYLYVTGPDDTWPGKVRAALRRMEAEDMIQCTGTAEREFLMDINKVRWTWKLRVYGPLTREAKADGQDGD